ncbi:MAG: hypothetical protein KC455_09975 [Carnobacterium sp.]|nr:hypothetical protein [Carnobacterium sp.]
MEKRMTIPSLYNDLFNMIDSFKYQSDIKGVILTKRNRAMTFKEFQKSMINNINYFDCLNKEYLDLITFMFENQEYLTDVRLAGILTYLQPQIKEDVPNLLISSTEFYKSKFKTENAITEALEFDYSYRKIENDILSQVLTVLCNNENFHMTKDLFYNSSKETIFEIKKYTEVYINLLLKNISFY